MLSKAKTPQEYLNNLPNDRKNSISVLRKIISKNLPVGFEETISYGMLGYVVPHSFYPNGYHCDPKLPLPFISIASQKNHISIYHMGMYSGELLDWFILEWEKYSTKNLDMGKSCIRFKKAEDIPLELIAQLCQKMTPLEWIDTYEKTFKNK